MGGNCFANDTNVNGTDLQPCTPAPGTLGAGNATGNGSGNGSVNGSGNLSVVNGSATANASCVCGPAATVAATVAEGIVVQLNVLSGGAGYTSAPTVVLSGGNCTSHASATATIDAASGSVASVVVTPGCVTPGGTPWGRDESRWQREMQGLEGDGFAEQRTTMPYQSYSRCVWRIQPPVPAGYTLRLNFDHFDTEQDGPDAPEPRYSKPNPNPDPHPNPNQGSDHVKIYDDASSWTGRGWDWQDYGKDPPSVAAMPRLLAESGRMGGAKRALPSVVSEARSALLEP